MKGMSELTQAEIDAFGEAFFVAELVVCGMVAYYDKIAGGESKLIDWAYRHVRFCGLVGIAAL